MSESPTAENDKTRFRLPASVAGSRQSAPTSDPSAPTGSGWGNPATWAEVGPIPAVGSVVKSRFVLEESIGSGGMGTVFKSRDLRKVEAQDRNPYVAIKILNESHAGNPQSDIFDGTSTVVPLEREGYVLQWLPEPAKSYPALYRDPEGYWVASHIFINTPGYNTALIPKGGEPKTYQDLLDPKWRGKIVWDGLPSASGGTGFIGTVLAEMGEQKGMDYLRAFAKQKVVNVAASAREVLDQVIAGEYPLALQIFNHHAVISAKKGAPVDWIKLEPATGTLSTVSIHKNAPHPNAAKLLFDFIISDEGQKVFRDADYLTADPAVPPREPSLTPEGGHFRTRFFSPEALEDNTAKWTQVFEQLFR